MHEEKQTQAVETFMIRCDGPPAETLRSIKEGQANSTRINIKYRLRNAARMMLRASRDMLRGYDLENDQRLFRGHLMCEELGELLLAMSEFDEAETLDAIVDLDYVVRGTAIQLQLPFDKAFDLVHAANMKKTSGAFTDRGGKKGKPKGWKPADLQPLLEKRDNLFRAQL